MICCENHPLTLTGNFFTWRLKMTVTVKPALPSRWLSTPDAAAYLNVSVSTLCNDRVTRSLNIPFTRLGRRILYDRQELDAYLLARMEGAHRYEEA